MAVFPATLAQAQAQVVQAQLEQLEEHHLVHCYSGSRDRVSQIDKLYFISIFPKNAAVHQVSSGL